MQKSFSDLEYAAKRKPIRRDGFLAEIDSVTPWGKLHELTEPFYSKVVGAGRPTIGLARMLRMYVAQQCFGLPDEGIEDAIYDSQSIRAFVGIDLGLETAPGNHATQVSPAGAKNQCQKPIRPVRQWKKRKSWERETYRCLSLKIKNN